MPLTRTAQAPQMLERQEQVKERVGSCFSFTTVRASSTVMPTVTGTLYFCTHFFPSTKRCTFSVTSILVLPFLRLILRDDDVLVLGAIAAVLLENQGVLEEIHIVALGVVTA